MHTGTWIKGINTTQGSEPQSVTGAHGPAGPAKDLAVILMSDLWVRNEWWLMKYVAELNREVLPTHT